MDFPREGSEGESGFPRLVPTEEDVKQALQNLPDTLLDAINYVPPESRQDGLLIKDLQDSLGINNSTASVYLLQLVEPERKRVKFPLIRRVQRQGDYGAYRYYLMPYVTEAMIAQAIRDRTAVPEVDQSIPDIVYAVQRLVLEVRDLKIRDQKKSEEIAQLLQQVEKLQTDLSKTNQKADEQKRQMDALQKKVSSGGNLREMIDKTLS
ncbi:hypothetical protein H6G52_03250 [Limnothrix sp. FACHB-881]|uniref:hypothetical protein n=1 Tax=Limnothrix sp. FACHB-881 TaxID=2692819 RepID=UPI001686F4E1|nr:hypothetical protein [Limnothrix sp. FACHB-881]MBD2634367.1 hypothetical protein [Limnothrix sp. FACHB-881]